MWTWAGWVTRRDARHRTSSIQSQRRAGKKPMMVETRKQVSFRITRWCKCLLAQTTICLQLCNSRSHLRRRWSLQARRAGSYLMNSWWHWIHQALTTISRWLWWRRSVVAITFSRMGHQKRFHVLKMLEMLCLDESVACPCVLASHKHQQTYPAPKELELSQVKASRMWQLNDRARPCSTIKTMLATSTTTALRRIRAVTQPFTASRKPVTTYSHLSPES